jgi:protein phosphatase
MSLPTPRDHTWRAAPRGGTPVDPGRTTVAEVALAARGLHAAAASSRGPRHAENEDCHTVLDGANDVFVVADGVGGGAMAAWASAELVARLHRALDGAPHDADRLRAALLDADAAIAAGIAAATAQPGAATVALCKAPAERARPWLVAWVGDCRAYRVPARRMLPPEGLTIDDTYRALQEAPPDGGSPDDPARMVGNGAVETPNVREVVLAAGDMLLLCSDGVHKHVGVRDLGRVLRGHAPLARRCARLVDLARAGGSRDDATVLVVRTR